MIRIKAAGLITVLFTTLAGGGGAVTQTSEFIIGGDFLGGVVMPHNGARLSPGFLKTLDSAGFTHLFLLVDTNLVNEANQEITNAHALGMGIILGHCEGTPDQDYWVHTRGNRWKFHPEDTIQFPRLRPYVGDKFNDARSGADAEAAMLCGDISTAESITAQLLTLYAGSSAAQKFSIPRLLMATMGDDSAVVNTRTNDILSGTFTDLERSQAQHIRNGYHRVLPRPFIRKARGEWQRSKDNPSDPDALDCTAYPNPFNASTTIAWTMHERDHAVLRVYDALGREILRPTDDVLEVGRHTVELRGRDLAPGLYFVHVRTSTQKAVLRILLEPVPGNR